MSDFDLSSKKYAVAMGQRAAQLAVSESESFDAARPLSLIAGYVFFEQDLSELKLEACVTAVEEFITKLTQEPDKFMDGKEVEAGEGNNTQLLEAIQICRDWLRDLKDCNAERPEDVRSGILEFLRGLLSDAAGD